MRFTFSFRFSFRLTWRDWTYNSVELPSWDETMEHGKQNQVIKPVTLGQLNHTEQFENMGFMKVRFHDKEKHLVLQTTRVPDLQFHYIKTDSSTGKNWLFDYIKTEFDWKKIHISGLPIFGPLTLIFKKLGKTVRCAQTATSVLFHTLPGVVHAELKHNNKFQRCLLSLGHLKVQVVLRRTNAKKSFFPR